MEKEHLDHAEHMVTELKEIMYRLRLMRYKMHAHYYPMIGGTLEYAADQCMSIANKLEEDLKIYREG